MHPLLLTTFVLLLAFTPSSSSSPPCTYSSANDIAGWCDSTPHPHPCRYYLARGRGPPRDRSDFYRQVLQVSFDLVRRAQSHLRALGRNCHTKRQRTAWLDCWRLYTHTAVQLNRTLHSSTLPCDAQTWLSAALTNLETCHKGFHEVGANPDLIWPVARYNVTDLISNTLAINYAANATAAGGGGGDEGHREWATVANRKLLQVSARADFVVSPKGSGNFRTIKEALDATAVLRLRQGTRIVIHVKAGVYNENIMIVSSMGNITMIGDGMGKTVITGSRSMANGYTTFSSPTFSVFGDGFIATGITFRNTYGTGAQAVAFLSGSDRSIFYRCGFEGYQDTLCVFSQRQFYRECDIYGTIDFIFGNAAAVFQNCNIYLRRPSHGESNAIAAQGRIDPNQNTGIVFQFCNIQPAPDLRKVAGSVKSYLGRPWQQYSRAIYMQSYISGIIDPLGWLPFNGNFALSTLYFAEFKNTGPGAKMSKRVKWSGYDAVARESLVRQFTVGRFIAGRSWLGATGVPFNPSF